ncbi:hypothetical protein [Streptomyces sp. NPDC097619]|uniref:hypothetical protein n=1 Tax=Streptomyces sp. NPDC097619 TaxID=3157228 RepID=UPI003330306C
MRTPGSRALVHALAWTLATAAAVTLSWWGVRTVMSGTAYDPPLAVPLSERPLASSTFRPVTGPSTGAGTGTPSTPPHASGTPKDGPTATGRDEPSAAPSAPDRSNRPDRGRSALKDRDGDDGEGSGDAGGPDGSDGSGVRSYALSGGRVAFDLGDRSAELVSATPAAGWRMQVWKQPTWIRVTFSRGGREVDAICSWHDHAPLVQVRDEAPED